MPLVEEKKDKSVRKKKWKERKKGAHRADMYGLTVVKLIYSPILKIYVLINVVTDVNSFF